MTVFNEYARYYDLFYRDKDYRGEAQYVERLILEHVPAARTILTLGCGSGRHDRMFADLGYSVTGVDCSREMLLNAEDAAKGNASLEYVHGDARTFRLERSFDAVVSLFHVVSYQITNDDIKAVFETARRHLKPGGIFIFDCWYGPGVLCDHPTVRVRELESDGHKVIRISDPLLHPNDNIVDVRYRVLVIGSSSAVVTELKETHRLRYLFIPEINEYLSQAGLKPLFYEKWLDGSTPDEKTWYLCCGARSACLETL